MANCLFLYPNYSELCFVHLAVRPQVNLHSIGLKRFAHLSDVQARILFIIYYTGCLMANCIFGVQCNTDTLICTAKVPKTLVCHLPDFLCRNLLTTERSMQFQDSFDFKCCNFFFENISYCFLFRTRSVPWGEDTLFTYNFSTFSKLFHPVF